MVLKPEDEIKIGDVAYNKAGESIVINDYVRFKTVSALCQARDLADKNNWLGPVVRVERPLDYDAIADGVAKIRSELWLEN